MSNNKQCSIEWLIQELEKYKEAPWRYVKNGGKETIIEQAKAMHKEEHSNTWDESVDNYKKRGENDMRHWVDFDDYYNETFGGNNEQQ